MTEVRVSKTGKLLLLLLGLLHRGLGLRRTDQDVLPVVGVLAPDGQGVRLRVEHPRVQGHHRVVAEQQVQVLK